MVGKAGEQALRRSAFQEAISHPVSVCRAEAKRKIVRSAISEALLPARGQSLIPIVCCQECNHTSDGSLNEQITIGGSDTGQPNENVAIRTLHDYHKSVRWLSLCVACTPNRRAAFGISADALDEFDRSPQL